MKIKLLFAGLVLSFVVPMPQANADCAPGYANTVDINVTTQVVTYSCIKLPDPTPEPVRPEPIAPTHTLNVKTPTQGLGIVGTPKQIETVVTSMVERVGDIPVNVCVEGGCNKMEVNATTKETKYTPLTKTEVRQQTDQMAKQAIQDAELAKLASQALPNIQPIDPAAEKVEPTPLVEEEPEWWADFMRALAEFYIWYNGVDWWSF